MSTSYENFHCPVDIPRADGAHLRVVSCVLSRHGLRLACSQHSFCVPGRVRCVGDGGAQAFYEEAGRRRRCLL
eukprot:1455536-Pyramimonas_sp.AAC.1